MCDGWTAQSKERHLVLGRMTLPVISDTETDTHTHTLVGRPSHSDSGLLSLSCLLFIYSRAFFQNLLSCLRRHYFKASLQTQSLFQKVGSIITYKAVLHDLEQGFPNVFSQPNPINLKYSLTEILS